MLAGRQIFLQPHPGAWPAIQIPAVGFQSVARHGRGGAVFLGSPRRHRAFPAHATAHHDSKPMPTFPGLSTSRLISVPITKALKSACARARAPKPLPAVMSPVRDMINSATGVSSSFLSGEFWFFCCTSCGASIAAAARWSPSRKCLGPMASEPSPKLTCCFWPAGRAGYPGKKPRKYFALPGTRFSTPWSTWSPGVWSTGARPD